MSTSATVNAETYEKILTANLQRAIDFGERSVNHILSRNGERAML
jgi:hypothetical protein